MGRAKPIDTTYNGFRFRSRLEARWAVFFDALQIKYEYEKEGYRLSNNKCYLPDFWLPEIGLWVEVKGEKPSPNYFGMLYKFRDEVSAILLVIGLPPFDNMNHLFAFDTTDSTGGSYDQEVCLLSKGNGDLYFATDDSRVSSDRHVFSDWEFMHTFDMVHVKDEEKLKSLITLPLLDARRLARQKRFEYGERGGTHVFKAR